MIDPNLITTKRVGELPTSVFSLTDKIPHEVGVDLKSGTIQQLLDLLRPLVGKLQFEVVRMSVNSQYIIDNFDLTPGPNMGLGTNLCLGFAICNGNNGTENLDGRSGVGYGTVNNFVGFTGGATTKNFNIPISGYGVGADTSGGTSGLLLVSSGQVENGEFLESVKKVSTTTAPVSINVQDPFIVQLYMMKL
jgi:hypothetical protein